MADAIYLDDDTEEKTESKSVALSDFKPASIDHVLLRRSPTFAKFAVAFAKFQLEVGNVEKNRENKNFNTRYADLAAVLEAVRPVLAANGIGVIQAPTYEDGIVKVTTILLYEDEWFESTCSCPVPKNNPQGVGIAITYIRRYALAAMCGISQEDADGNLESKPSEPNAQDKKVAELLGKIQAADEAGLVKITEWVNAGNIKKYTAVNQGMIKAALLERTTKDE